MGKYGSVSVGRLRDRRWKLSPQAINTIKRLHSQGRSMNSLRIQFGVSPGTVAYWVDDRYRDMQRAKNAQRRRTKDEEREQTANKQLRRDLVRDKVRKYTAKQMRALGIANIDHYRALSRRSVAKFRREKPEQAKANWSRYWHTKKCKCLNYGDHHIYGSGWPKGRSRKITKEV